METPLIGITVDNRDNSADSGRYESSIAYSRAVAEAGGVPVLLPHEPELATTYATTCDGLVLTGGVDPDTAAFGEPMHPKARPIDPRRQAFELALLDAAATRDLPVLGVCLGMQLMALRAGGRLHQYLPDVMEASEAHRDDRRHAIELRQTDSVLGQLIEAGCTVVSYHQQAVADAGSMRVVATAPDGVIEAIDDPSRRFWIGVQWHPERGGAGSLNRGLFERLIAACRLTSAAVLSRRA